MTFSTMPPAVARPSLASALLQAWRAWRERDVLLPVGPAASGPWAGSGDVDHDRDRVLGDLRAARRSP